MAKTTIATMSNQDLEQEILQARTRALLRRSEEPFAIRASYDSEYQRVEVELSNGFWFAFPPALFADLGKAHPDELSDLYEGVAVARANLPAMFPVIGLLSLMSNRMDHDLVHLYGIQNGERKALNKETPNVV